MQLIQHSGGRPVCTSLQISNHFEKKHCHVLEAIRNLDCSPEFNRSNFRLIEFLDDRNRQQPAYEITRDGFTFLAMGFTGPAAARWKERYIEAFNRMELVLLQAGQSMPALENRMDKLESAMVSIAAHTERQAFHLAELVEVSHQQAQKFEVTESYIRLLEVNQKGKATVTREVEAAVLTLFAQGMGQQDIARNVRVSPSTVCQIVGGTYPFALPEADKSRLYLGEELEYLLALEREKLRLRREENLAKQRRNQEALKMFNAAQEGGAL